MLLRSSLLFIAVLSWGAPLAAAPVTFIADLTGPSEEPPNASPGSGFAEITIDSVLHTLRVVVTFSDLTAFNTAALIHVINGPGDANLADTIGPVATTTPTFPGFPSGTTAGSYDQTLDGTLASSYRGGWITDSGGTTALAEAALFSGIVEGRAYLNIHTTNFPAGEIRGFLNDTPPAPIPEPTTLLLFGTTAAGLGLARWRHHRRGKQQP
jgi:hypothetical protein